MLTNVSGVYENKQRKTDLRGRSKAVSETGIRVLIDGKDACEETWGKLFEVREDGSFYMGDYILEDIPREDPQGEGVNEEGEDYMKARRLKEIHFDIVYHR